MQIHSGGIISLRRNFSKILILTFTDQEDFGVIYNVPLQVDTLYCTFIISQNEL